MIIRIKTSFCIAQYPVLRIAQSGLHFTSLADLFNQTLHQFVCEASSHTPMGDCISWFQIMIARLAPGVTGPRRFAVNENSIGTI